MLYCIITFLIGGTFTVVPRLRKVAGHPFYAFLATSVMVIGAGGIIGTFSPVQKVNEEYVLQHHYETNGPLLITYEGTSWYIANGDQHSVQRSDVNVDSSSRGVFIRIGERCKNGFWSLSIWSLCEDHIHTEIAIPEGAEYVIT